MSTKRRSSRIYPVLNRPKLIGGVEDSLALGNMIVGLAMVMNLGQWELIPVFVLIHAVMRIAGKRESSIRKVYRKYSSQADNYDPFPRDMGDKIRSPRPEGWGRGVPC